MNHIQHPYQQQPEKYLDKLIDLYNTYYWLIDVLPVNFVTHRQWERLAPEWREALMKHMGETDNWSTSVLELTSDKCDYSIWPDSLREYLTATRDLPLPRVQSDQAITNMSKHIKFGMNDKKIHEVELMSQLIKQVADERNITSVIDLGSGQGYLSRALAFEHGLEVLAVDMSEIQTKGAVKFDNKALKIQKKSEDGLPNLKHVTERITPENIADVLTRWGSSIDKSWLVTGLHTCGDLSPMIFNLFAECPQVACVVNVGCCYNALTSSGFPMSSYVKKKCMPFGSTARVLSCHSPSRWLDEGEQCITISNNYLFRGLFQEMMVDRGLSDINDPPILGRIKQNKSFPLFVKAALKKMKLPDDTITSEEAEIHYSQCKEKSVDRQFLALWTLRALLSPVIESIILMDRYLYLKSSIQSTHPSDNQGCWMFPLFDQSASPRNVVLIASK